MKVIYHCYGSAHSSIVAAAIHLGRISSNTIPSVQDFIQLRDFDVATNDSLGHLFYKGRDEQGHEIYTIGLGPESKIIKRSILSVIEGYKRDHHFFFAEALPHINRIAKIGGALSRRYGWVTIGRRMAILGMQQSFPRLVQFVEETKKAISQKES